MCCLAAMEALLAEQDRMIESGSLGKSVDDIQKTIDLLVSAREAVASSKMIISSVDHLELTRSRFR